MSLAKRSANPLLDGYHTGGGLACLEFVNTVDWRASDHPVEFLTDGAAVDAWLELALDRPPLDLDERQVAELRGLREALYRLIRGIPHAGDLGLLNDALAGGGERDRLAVGPRGYIWWAAAAASAPAVLNAELARSTAELLVDRDRLARVKECHGPGCGWLFLDESRAGNRRWCSMTSCGNRAKARAHYRRMQDAGG